MPRAAAAVAGGNADFAAAKKFIREAPVKKHPLDKILLSRYGAPAAFALLFAFVFYAAFGKYSPMRAGYSAGCQNSPSAGWKGAPAQP
ncbi:MAG: hypothetical protein ACLUHK_03845 [Eubacteriales bacterium]